MGATGIPITGGVTFGAGAIVNSGTIDGTGGTAIDVSGASSAMTIDQTGGSISGAINLSANADLLNISGGTIAGNIVGNGSQRHDQFQSRRRHLHLRRAYGFSNINQVNVNSGTVILDGAEQRDATPSRGGTLQVGDAAEAGAALKPNLSVTRRHAVGPRHHHRCTVHDRYGGTLAPGAGSIGTLNVVGSAQLQLRERQICHQLPRRRLEDRGDRRRARSRSTAAARWW